MRARAAKLALEAWLAYDASLTIIAHRAGSTGWQGKHDPKLDRLYERALTLSRVAFDLPLGALGEGELNPAEVAAIVAEGRGS